MSDYCVMLLAIIQQCSAGPLFKLWMTWWQLVPLWFCQQRVIMTKTSPSLALLPATFPIATICAHRGKLDRSSTRMLPQGRSKVRTILAIPAVKGTECQSILSFVVVLWWSSGLITKLKFDQRRFLATSWSKGGKWLPWTWTKHAFLSPEQFALMVRTASVQHNYRQQTKVS